MSISGDTVLLKCLSTRLLFFFLWEVLQADLCESAAASAVQETALSPDRQMFWSILSWGCAGRPSVRPFCQNSVRGTHTYTPRSAPARTSVMVPFWGWSSAIFAHPVSCFFVASASAAVQFRVMGVSQLVQISFKIKMLCDASGQVYKYNSVIIILVMWDFLFFYQTVISMCKKKVKMDSAVLFLSLSSLVVTTAGAQMKP